jgi:membrane protease YdiL (CAAX protease family)
MVYREEGREGLKAFFGRVIKWRVRWVWYLAVLLLPLMRGVIPVAVAYGLINRSLPPFAGPVLGAPPWPDALWFFFYILLIGGGQEELGWRGYALPKLQTRHSALVSSLIVGVAWSMWHLPMMFIPGSSLYGTPFISYLIILTVQSVVYTWVYNGTGSILLCVLLHTWSNFVAAYFVVAVNQPIYGVVALAAQLLVVALLLAIYGPKWLARRRVLGDNGTVPHH